MSKYFINTIRLTSTNISEQMINTITNLLNNSDHLMSLEIYNCEFSSRIFDILFKSIANSSLITIIIDKIKFNENYFSFFVQCINQNNFIENLSLKRVYFDFDPDKYLTKFIIENQNLKTLEFSLCKDYENKSHVYSSILNLVSFNHSLIFVNLEDHRLEKEEIHKLESFYKNNYLSENKTLKIDFNLQKDYLIRIFEIYLEYRPDIFLKFSINNFKILYDNSTPKIEINHLSDIEDIYQNYAIKYNIHSYIFNISNYFHIKKFFDVLKEKDFMKEITLNLKKCNIFFLELFSEYLYRTKNLNKLILNSQFDIVTIMKHILLPIFNNTDCLINLIVNEIEYEEYINIYRNISENNNYLKTNRILVSKNNYNSEQHRSISVQKNMDQEILVNLI